MNGIIKFLDHNGMRPIIALVVIIGALAITLKSDKICVVQVEYPPVTSRAAGTQPQIIFRDNPVCSKYFEIAALVLGGLLGLTAPGKSSRSQPEDEAAREQKTTFDENKSRGEN
ncbi:hypothetical protein QUB47_09675 [Microcoleus sp. AT9_B5]